MIQPKRNQYALRAMYELAKRSGSGPVKISDIARAQSIPPRFLEVILSQLKASGFVSAKRGFTGGYILIPPPDEITVGDVLRFLQGDAETESCLACVSTLECPFDGRCAFSSLWHRVKKTVFEIYDQTTFRDLLDREMADT